MYRWFLTSSGKLVIAGKNAEQNEEIMKQVKSKDVILHTAAPGSPFCVIKKPNAKDLEEAAIFCASFSKEWKRGKKNVEVHLFTGDQVYKTDKMKAGTFGVLGKVMKKKVKLELVISFQKGKIRAVPQSCFNPFYKKIKIPKIVLRPGKIKKEEAAKIIQERLNNKKLNIPLDEILQAIPAGGFSINEK